MAELELYFVLIVLAIYLFTKHFLRKIRNLPPTLFPTLPILGHLYLFRKPPLHRTLSRLSDRYGPILLLQLGSRPVLVVSSPSAVEECFTKNDVVFANRPRLLVGKLLGQDYTWLSWSPYGHNWRTLRRISAVKALSSNYLQMLSSIRTDEVRSLLGRLSRNPRDQAVDMKTVFFELMLNVMMRMIEGRRCEDVAEVARIRAMVAETFRLSVGSYIGDYLPFLRLVGVSGFEKRLIALRENRDGFMQELIEESRSRMRSGGGGGGGSDEEVGEKKVAVMTEVLLSLQQSEPEYYTDEMIRGINVNLLNGGTDSSVGTMEWALSLMLNNPQVLHKAQTEIDEVVGQHRLIEESDMYDLPYLRCIINETLRMYSPSPITFPHESSEECTVGGFLIPRGTMLLVNMWAIQNDPKLWEEPRKFRPERFEGLEGYRDGFKFMPFGSGRRGCPGEGLALRMIGLGLGSVIQCFDWERVSEEMVDMTEGSGITLNKEHPLMAKCRPRPKMVNLLSQL